MRNLLLILLFLSPLASSAQNSRMDSVNRKRNTITRDGMLVLSGVSLVNVASGIVGMQGASGQTKGFHQMNLYAGIINLAFAQLGYWTSRSALRRSQGPEETYREQERTEKLFLFNTALDLGYIALGAYITERGISRLPSDGGNWIGRGKSVMLQGAALAVFDGVMYLLHNRNGNRLQPGKDRLSYYFTGAGGGLVYRF